MTPDYSQMSWDELYRLRNSLAPNDPRQAEIAPYEHQAFARESVSQNPLMAASLAVATPAYTLSKLLGISKARSPASLAEITQGYQGIGQGLRQYFGGQ